VIAGIILALIYFAMLTTMIAVPIASIMDFHVSTVLKIVTLGVMDLVFFIMIESAWKNQTRSHALKTS
jgi:hypothetical protein